MTSRRRRLVYLSDRQRNRVMVASIQLPPARRYGFVLRVEDKLALRQMISDALLEDIIAHVTTELEAAG